MNPDQVKFNIRQKFKPIENRRYFILEAPGIEDLVIPESKILELPKPLRRRFYMQKGISFRILMPAFNQWLRENGKHGV